MASIKERLELLDRIPLFSGLTKRHLREIANLVKEVDHPAGKTIVREGKRAHALHVIVDGTAVITIGGREMRRLGPGDYFGEIALFDSGPRTATVSATTPLRALAILRSDFLGAVASDGELATRLLVHLAKVVRDLDAQSAE